jgi:hypothetical protein
MKNLVEAIRKLIVKSIIDGVPKAEYSTFQ